MSSRWLSRSWTAIQRLLFARTSLEAQLYPPLARNVVFRVFEPRDFEACLAIYHRNETGRFPAGHTPKFIEYLKKEPKALVVAECNSLVVGYGGINLLAPEVAALCYGIVDPEYQRQRIGSALTLLRIAQLAGSPNPVVVLIFAVDASIPIYRRYGFIEKTRWKAEDGSNHPVGVLHVHPNTLKRLRSALNRRGLCIQGSIVLQPSREASCEIQRGPNSVYKIRINPPGQETGPTGAGA